MAAVAVSASRLRPGSCWQLAPSRRHRRWRWSGCGTAAAAAPLRSVSTSAAVTRNNGIRSIVEFIGNRPLRMAAIDMGTNSFHMVVVSADETGSFTIVDQAKEIVRLGSGSGTFSIIAHDAETRALEAIKRLVGVADARDSSLVRLVATSAVREAQNKNSFVRKVKSVCNRDVEILSGAEEARMIFLGVARAVPDVRLKRSLVFDIGGGSTEFILGGESGVRIATSLKLGHIRLTERLLGSSASSNRPKASSSSRIELGRVNEVRRYIELVLKDEGIKERIDAEGSFTLAVASSGTVAAVASIASALGLHKDENVATRLRKEDNDNFASEISVSEIRGVVERILSAESLSERLLIPGLSEKRANVIVGGALLLEGICDLLEIQSLKISPFALREGVIVDSLSRIFNERHLYDQSYAMITDSEEDLAPGAFVVEDVHLVRRSSVLHLAKRFDVDGRVKSACNSASLARQLAMAIPQIARNNADDQSQPNLRTPSETELEILEAAGILHLVGSAISHRARHKHAYYIIKNSEFLVGFTSLEVEQIALLARYHRRGIPKSANAAFSLLPNEDLRARTVMFAKLLRLAVNLERCGNAAIAKLEFNVNPSNPKQVVIVARPLQRLERGMDLELWSGREELYLIEEEFGLSLTIVEGDPLR